MSSKFLTSLLSSPVPVIMEIKRRDGHKRDLVRGRPLSEIVAAYQAAGAPCLSVVTGRWFGGSDQMLEDVVRLTTLPLLQKDFITRESQLAKAKAIGASAVLLTAGLLPRSVLQRLIGTALRQGLTPFVEASNERELEAVVHGEDCVVAINNKDIASRERGPADIDRSVALLEPALATGTRCPVSASGINDPEVAAGLVSAGFEGVLVGTGLLLADSVQSWIRDFQRYSRAGAEARVSERARC